MLTVKSMKHSYRKEFYDIYTKELLPKLLLLEKDRTKALFLLVSGTFILIVGLFLSVFGYYKCMFCSNTYIVVYGSLLNTILFGLFCAALYFLKKNIINNFKKTLKKTCMNDAIKCFKGLSYGHSDITSTAVATSQLFGEYNKINFDDKFYGEYKDTSFSISETDLKYISESSRHRWTFNIFKGVIISIPIEKKIIAHTIVTTKGDKQIKNSPGQRIAFIIFWVGIGIYLIISGFFEPKIIIYTLIGLFFIIYSIYDYFKNHKHFQKLNLEDVVFDKRFCVQSQDQIEGRYLVTPAFMDKLNNLRTAFGTKNIKCAFFDNQVMFAISTNKDLFEIGNLFVSLSNSKQINEFYNEITSIYDMIDYFKLYEKTYRHCE